MHLIEFLLKNGSFQFVLVFVDKFMNLVTPYVDYEYFSDGTDRGFGGTKELMASKGVLKTDH